MALGTLSPVAIQQFFDNSGRPLAGGSLSFFAAGTNTPLAAYSDKDLLVPLANPVVLDAAGRAPELFLAAASYKQVLKDALGVTLWTADNIISAALLAQQSFAPTVTTIATGGTSHNIATGTTHNKVIFCTNATDATLTGFADGIDGDTLLVVSAGAGNVYLAPDNAGSAPTARLTNYVTSGMTPLAAGYGTAMYMYIGSLQRWKMVGHAQGRYITMPYNAADYVVTGTGSGTWVPGAAGQVERSFLVDGSTLEVTLTLGASTVTGSGTHLGILNWPYMFKGPPAGGGSIVPMTWFDAAASGIVSAHVLNQQSTLYFYKFGGALWTASTTTFIWGQARYQLY